MGRYSSNIFNENGINDNTDVPVIEGFDYSAGACLRLIGESYTNERVSFDDSMQKEFNELGATFKKEQLEKEGLVNEAAEIVVVTEGFGDVLSKLKTMVMKAWQKIKSLYEALKVKISSFLTRDYNKFYKKHVNTFNSNSKSYKGSFKFKVLKKELSLTAIPFGKFDGEAAGALSSINGMNGDALKKRDEEINDGSFLESLLSSIVSGATRSSFKKDLENDYFDNKDSFESVTDSMTKQVNEVLGTTKIVKTLEDSNKKNGEFFKKLLSEIDSAKGKLSSEKNSNIEIASFKGTSSASGNSSDTKKLNTFSRTVSVNQTANNMVNGAYIGLVKMHIAQCKALFTKVVAKSKMNEQVYLDALAESAYDETLETLDTLEVVVA